MCMSIFSAQSQPVFGCPNAHTYRVWTQFYRKQIFAGLFSTRTACCLENRGRASRFMRPAILQQGLLLLRATVTQADKSGARMKAIPQIQPTGTSTVMLVSIFPWNIYGRLRVE